MTRLDAVLASVTPAREVVLDARDLTPEQVEAVYAQAKALGLHASGTRNWILLRATEGRTEH